MANPTPLASLAATQPAPTAAPALADDALAQLCLLARDAGRQASRLRRILYRFERDAALVDDTIQDALLVALENLPSYRGDASLRSWFTGVLLNVARRHVKTASLASARLSSLDALNEAGDLLPDDACDRSEDSAAARELAELAARCIASFAPPLRDTFMGVCLEGRSYEAVAVEQQVPVGTVRSRVHRARQVLRAMLEQAGSPATGTGAPARRTTFMVRLGASGDPGDPATDACV